VRVRLIGYWCGASDRSPDENECLPDPRDLIDESWNQERELVASYLEHGRRPWVFAGHSYCRLCGMVNGSAEFTDGVYLWPEGLAHYVREHSVKLPDEVLAHVRRRYNEVESLDGDRDWSIEYTDDVLLWPEGFAGYIREHSAELPDEVVTHIRRHSDEVETLFVDSDWWPKVTIA
jgi:hypothetical protein